MVLPEIISYTDQLLGDVMRNILLRERKEDCHYIISPGDFLYRVMRLVMEHLGKMPMDRNLFFRFP